MHLYQVYMGDEYCCFVFAETKNRARYMCHNYFDEDYIDTTAYLRVKDTGGKEALIDSDYDENYSRVTNLGYRYATEEEMDDAGY